MSNLKTILFLTPKMVVGGAEKYILQKSEWLIKKNYNVVIASIGGDWENEVNLMGGKHYKLDYINTDPNLLNKSSFLKYLKQLKQIIDNENVSIIEANQFSPALWGYYVSEIYNIPFLMNVLSSNIFYQGNINHVNFLKHIDNLGLYYNSECSNKKIEEERNVVLENCCEIPIPVNKNQFIKDDTTNINYILTVCRMAPDKMYVKYLIKDFYNLVLDNKYKNLKLIVVGDGPLFAYLKSMVDKYNIHLKKFSSEIQMHGTVVGEELEKLFSGCMFYVGMGTTVLQAAKHGKSSILATPEKKYMKTSIGYFSEDEHYSIGFLFNKMYSDSFKNRMEFLIDDIEKLKNLEHRSQRLFEAMFETNKVMEKWIIEYKKVINISIQSNHHIFQENQLFYLFKKLKYNFLIKWNSK